MASEIEERHYGHPFIYFPFDQIKLTSKDIHNDLRLYLKCSDKLEESQHRCPETSNTDVQEFRN